MPTDIQTADAFLEWCRERVAQAPRHRDQIALFSPSSSPDGFALVRRMAPTCDPRLPLQPGMRRADPSDPSEAMAWAEVDRRRQRDATLADNLAWLLLALPLSHTIESALSHGLALVGWRDGKPELLGCVRSAATGMPAVWWTSFRPCDGDLYYTAALLERLRDLSLGREAMLFRPFERVPGDPPDRAAYEEFPAPTQALRWSWSARETRARAIHGRLGRSEAALAAPGEAGATPDGGPVEPVREMEEPVLPTGNVDWGEPVLLYKPAPAPRPSRWLSAPSPDVPTFENLWWVNDGATTRLMTFWAVTRRNVLRWSYRVHDENESSSAPIPAHWRFAPVVAPSPEQP